MHSENTKTNIVIKITLRALLRDAAHIILTFSVFILSVTLFNSAIVCALCLFIKIVPITYRNMPNSPVYFRESLAVITNPGNTPISITPTEENCIQFGAFA